MKGVIWQLTRRPLRNDARQIILDRILNGEIPAGSRIIESVLAAELGISRTPMREALLELKHYGFLRSDLARGFMVLPLTVREVEELYPIIWHLEKLAMQITGLEKLQQQISTLRALNLMLQEVKDDPNRALELDSKWHQHLTAACTNKKLLKMIREMNHLIRRYEYAYMWNKDLVLRSFHEHANIIDTIARGDLDKALELIEQHWSVGMASLKQRMQQNMRQ